MYNRLVRAIVLFVTAVSLNACNHTDSTFAVSGVVNNAAEGVTVTVTGPMTASTVTDASGSFSVGGLRAGQYTVSPTQAGFTFTPIRQDVALGEKVVITLVFDRQQPVEGLSSTDLERIDASPESSLPEDQVILPNGQPLSDYANTRGITPDDGSTQSPTNKSSSTTVPHISAPPPTTVPLINALPPATGPQQKKNDVVSKMLRVARNYACGRSTSNPCTTWNFAADPSDPINKPAQTGLTYVYGGKNPNVRTLPQDGYPKMTYGMDCSGLVYNIATAAGIPLPQGTAATQGNPDSWGIPPEWQLKMKLITDGLVESGDIVAWSDHIGIAESSGSSSSVNVISSTGQPGDGEKNIKPPRGPRSLLITQLKSSAPTILRLVTTLSGNFDMHIRCQDQPTDAAIVNFSINNDNGGPFQSAGSGTDYNGTPLCFNLNGEYDQNNNIASATLSLCDNSRSDSFVEELLADDTGYFTLTKVIDNGGCTAEARLVRNLIVAGAQINVMPQYSSPAGEHSAPALFIPRRTIE